MGCVCSRGSCAQEVIRVVMTWRGQGVGVERLAGVFDDERAVANAGRVLASTFAGRLGIEQVVDETVDLGGCAGAARPGRKLLTFVCSAFGDPRPQGGRRWKPRSLRPLLRQHRLAARQLPRAQPRPLDRPPRPACERPDRRADDPPPLPHPARPDHPQRPPLDAAPARPLALASRLRPNARATAGDPAPGPNEHDRRQQVVSKRPLAHRHSTTPPQPHPRPPAYTPTIRRRAKARPCARLRSPKPPSFKSPTRHRRNGGFRLRYAGAERARSLRRKRARALRRSRPTLRAARSTTPPSSASRSVAREARHPLARDARSRAR